MFTLTPIGSCRITTPLKRGQNRHGYALNMDRCYGYCHSPAEAVQMARFMHGEVEISEAVWPLVSRSHSHALIGRDTHETSDLYVVELCSAKEVMIDSVSIQLNYLKTTFSDFFADQGRAMTFWSIVDTDDQDELRTFLEADWSETDAQREQSNVLRRLERKFVTRESLRASVETLMDLLPRVLFVSHVDAVKPDGQTIKSRSDFITLVREEVHAAGGLFYNPTELMQDVGQTHAIEDESAGLAHFTDDFADLLIRDWMRLAARPATDDMILSGSPQAMAKLRPQIDADLAAGNFFEVATRLEALSAEASEIDPLLQRTNAAAQAALDTFYEDRNGLGPNSAQSLFDRACGLGLFGNAAEIQELHPEVLDPLTGKDLLRIAELAKLAETDNAAMRFAFHAWTAGAPNAASLLADLGEATKTDVLAEIGNADRNRFLSDLTPADRLRALYANGAEFIEIVDTATPASEMVDYIGYLTENFGIGHAAELLAHWREANDADRVRAPELVAILDEWLADATACDDALDRIHLVNAVLYASPRHGPARNTMRDLRKALALRIRAAGAAGDIDTLDALTGEVSALTNGLPELDLWRARLRFAAGEYQIAIELGRSAAAGLPEKLDVWVLLMRAAVKLGNQAQACDFARQVSRLSTEETPRFTAEAEAVLKSELIEA